MRHTHQLAPAVTFLHLTIDQIRSHLPPEDFPPSAKHLAPVSKMGGQGVEVEVQAITGEERNASRSQELSQGVKNQVRHVLRAGTELEDGKKLRRGVETQPKPLHLRMAAQPRAQFIQLDMREPEMGEETFMQGVCMRACARQPGGDRGLSKAENSRGREIGSSPSARAESTMATWYEGVLSRYRAVLRLAVNVVRQA